MQADNAARVPDVGVYDVLYGGAYPFTGLSEADVRIALHHAHGLFDDHGLLHEFASAAEEAVIEARGQAREP